MERANGLINDWDDDGTRVVVLAMLVAAGAVLAAWAAIGLAVRLLLV